MEPIATLHHEGRARPVPVRLLLQRTLQGFALRKIQVDIAGGDRCNRILAACLGGTRVHADKQLCPIVVVFVRPVDGLLQAVVDQALGGLGGDEKEAATCLHAMSVEAAEGPQLLEAGEGGHQP
jgi:hypothetical protein